MDDANDSAGKTTRLTRPAGGQYDLSGCALKVVAGLDRGKVVTVEGRALRIGKGADCDLVLTDAAVSRHHVLVSPAPDGFVIEDLGSTNGTEVNGVAVPSARVTGPCRIQIGGTAIDLVPVQRKLVARPSTAERLEGLLGASPAMRGVYSLIRQVAPTEATVVITGQTGTGKEVASRAVHGLSLRASGPFEVIDCGNMDRELLGSELFGHQKGAFTGAVSAHRGAFDRARGGTVFLDEIGELPMEIQTRLLGVLQRREVRPLGADAAHPIDARVVAATHRDLEGMVEQGTFREDLYFRLAVITIELPPLRERLEDIPQLVEHFLTEFVAPGAPLPAVKSESMDYLKAQGWKGNIRELRNVVQRAVVLSGGGAIELAHLQRPGRPAGASGAVTLPRVACAGTALEQAEARTIQEALARNHGNKSRTARELGIALATLKRRCKDYGLGGASSEDDA